MQYPKYQTLSVSPDYTIYTFISSGTKGEFEIEVQFTPIEETGYYNLGFGALDDNRQIDDTIILNNGDRDKILATVAGFAKEFLDKHPHAAVAFSGSSPARTRLYRRAISINLEELSLEFEILGFLQDEDLTLEAFRPANNYTAFVVKKRVTFEI
jgi:hypothetical protein